MPAKIAIVGGGKFGEMHLKTFTQLEREGRAELVGLADLNEELLAQRSEQYGVRTYTDYMEMIEKENPDGITVATPDFLHKKIALDAMNAGRHVLVEKPMDVTTAGCIEMKECAEKNNLLLQVDFHKRYDPYHRKAHGAIRSGAIGNVQYAYGWMEDQIFVPRDWFPHWAPKSSSLWFLGVHMIDLLRWQIGSNGVRVWGTENRGKLSSIGVDTPDSVQLKVEFQNGAHASIDTSWILPESFESVVNQGFRIVGSEGIFEVDSQDRGSRTCTVGEGSMTQNYGFYLEDKDKQGNDVWYGYGIDSIADFADNVNAINDGVSVDRLKGIFGTAEDGLEVTRIAEAAQKSIETKGIVEIER